MPEPPGEPTNWPETSAPTPQALPWTPPAQAIGGYPPYPGGYPPPYPDVIPPSSGRKNELGTASLLFGIFAAAFFWFPVVGLLLGVTAGATGVAAHGRIKRGEADNNGATITGVVLGTLASIAGAVIVMALLYFMISYQTCISNAHNRAEYAQC